MNRMGTVEEVADANWGGRGGGGGGWGGGGGVFLSLPQASFITGQALAVDAAWSHVNRQRCEIHSHNTPQGFVMICVRRIHIV